MAAAEDALLDQASAMGVYAGMMAALSHLDSFRRHILPLEIDSRFEIWTATMGEILVDLVPKMAMIAAGR